MDIEKLEIEKMKLQSYLDKTDYIVIKKMESYLTGREMLVSDLDRYDSLMRDREGWRQQINTLQQQITTAQSQ